MPTVCGFGGPASSGRCRKSPLAILFGIPEHDGMLISELRAELGHTMEAFANEVGLNSKGYVNDLEKAQERGEEVRVSVRVALAIEALSKGRIDAASLNPDVRLVRDTAEDAA